MRANISLCLKLALLTAVVFLGSCKKDIIIVGSCNNAASGFCNEFTGAAYKPEKVQLSCEKNKMIFIAGACPAEGRVGSCLVYKGKNSESYYRYYSNFPGFGVHLGDGVAAAAEKQCTKLKGEWIPD